MWFRTARSGGMICRVFHAAWVLCDGVVRDGIVRPKEHAHARIESIFCTLQDRILMLRAVDKGPCVVVCSTCRVSADEREDSQGRRGGALLAEALRERQTQDPDLSGVAVEEMPCLFACQRHCVVHIRAPGRIGYVLGDFTPDGESAQAILEYAALQAASDHGQVPYRQWPQGVKGHFITRTPPEGFVAT